METSQPDLQSLLPLREPTFFILLSLASGEKHGYAMIKAIEGLSGATLKLSTGTLYEALARLVEQGLIERVEAAEKEGEKAARDQDQRSRARKAYRLSRLGMRLLKAEMERMQNLVVMTRLHLGEEPR